jgi:hypothetical protein
MNQVTALDPRHLFARLARELPVEVRDHVYVVGSLAAACHHAERIQGGTVRTKDADLVIHPASGRASAAALARHLLELNWRHKPSDHTPGTSSTAPDQLPAIRLYPPDHHEYFVEILIVPAGENAGPKPWVSVELDDGWYGLPSFEFLALTLIDRQRSPEGLEYAQPAMMALANLLSHPDLGEHIMSTPVEDRMIHRSSKDLGRVLALARLETRDETEAWAARWRLALEACFPTRWRALAARAGAGLRALLDDDLRFDEAWHCCVVGLLAGVGVTHEQLRYTALQLLADAIEPLESAGRA